MKKLTGLVLLCLVVIVATGCAGNADHIRVAVKMMGAANDVAPGLHYVQATGGFNIAPLNSIIYKHEKPKSDGSDITVLVSSASPEFWSEVVKIATGSAAFVGGMAVHGVSFPAAKAAVTTVTNTASGGSTGTVTQTGASSTATNSPTTTNTATGGASGSLTTGTVTGGTVSGPTVSQ